MAGVMQSIPSAYGQRFPVEILLLSIEFGLDTAIMQHFAGKPLLPDQFISGEHKHDIRQLARSSISANLHILDNMI